MALDESLMESVRNGSGPTLRFYRWSTPCISLGRNQPTGGGLDPKRLLEAGVDVVRRPTGGRAVLHHDEITYSVVLPAREFGTPRTAYRRINSLLVDGLARLGAGAAIQPHTGTRAPDLSTVPCFAQPVEGEVLAIGRKLIGSAQLCRDGVLLQHGSLPLRRSAHEPLLGSGLGAPAYLASVLDPLPRWEDLVAALIGAWKEATGDLEVLSESSPEASPDPRLVERHRAPDWVWRR
jgi:lipoyl(octanoyl) transferase